MVSKRQAVAQKRGQKKELIFSFITSFGFHACKENWYTIIKFPPINMLIIYLIPGTKNPICTVSERNADRAFNCWCSFFIVFICSRIWYAEFMCWSLFDPGRGSNIYDIRKICEFCDPLPYCPHFHATSHIPSAFLRSPSSLECGRHLWKQFRLEDFCAGRITYRYDKKVEG